MKKEIERLLELKRTERDKFMERIKTQVKAPFPSYCEILAMTEKSHPWTTELMYYGVAVGGFAVLNWKGVFEYPRPTQMEEVLSTKEKLEPPIDVPGHSSYPSGHSTQGHLISLVLSEVRPDANPALMAFARDVAANRERAGLHYRWDSAAGAKLGQQSHSMLKKCRSYAEAVTEAQKEWK